MARTPLHLDRTPRPGAIVIIPFPRRTLVYKLQASRFAVYCPVWNLSGMTRKPQSIWRTTQSRLTKQRLFFDDPLYVDFYDPDHSYDEQRYLIVGESWQRRLLIVSSTERGDTIRLISAREATPAERRDYERG